MRVVVVASREVLVLVVEKYLPIPREVDDFSLHFCLAGLFVDFGSGWVRDIENLHFTPSRRGSQHVRPAGMKSDHSRPVEGVIGSRAPQQPAISASRLQNFRRIIQVYNAVRVRRAEQAC